MRKNEIDKLSHSYARRLSASSPTSTSDLASRAKDSLSSINNVYQVATDATDVLKTLLSQPDLSPKDVNNLANALKSVLSTLVEAREEARRTVSDLSLPSAPTLDPPGPIDEAGTDSIYNHLTNFSPGENSGRIFPDTDDLLEEEAQENKRKADK